MIFGLARRMLTEVEPRLLGKFALNFGLKGVISVERYKARLRKGIHFPPFLYISVINSCNLTCQGCWVDVQHPRKMIDKATNPQLKQGLQTHLTETQGHVKRLEEVFRMHGQPAKGTTCAAMDGILEEAKDILGVANDNDVIDAAIISSAQAVEHYEITRYGTLIAFAKQLGREDCASVLKQNLDEEYAADRKLSSIAEGRVNRKAA